MSSTAFAVASVVGPTPWEVPQISESRVVDGHGNMSIAASNAGNEEACVQDGRSLARDVLLAVKRDLGTGGELEADFKPAVYSTGPSIRPPV